MDYISNNPYRILGVFANEPVKTRTANIAKIRAFKKVGKNCSFNSDFTQIYGSIERSDDAIENAVSLLATAENAEFYSYFWLHKTDKLDIESNAGIDIIRSSINENTVADYVNVFIGALCICNNDLAAQSLVKLFISDYAPNDLIKERIIVALNNCCYGHGSFETGNQWWYRFKDACSAIANSENILEFIRKIFNRESIRNLLSIIDSEIKDSNNGNDTQSAQSAYRAVARMVIDVIKETSNIETKEPNPEAQIALAKYANHLLNQCKTEYSKTRFWDAKPAENMLEVLRFAYRISYSSKVKDECTEFGKKVKSELKYLAPHDQQAQSAAIRREIEAFCDKPNETRWALLLLRNCASPLIEIKCALGKDNAYYQRISTRIADNALYACMAELSSAKRKYSNPCNDKELATKNLYRTLKQALQLKVDISQLDVEDSFISDKFQPFINRLNDDCKEYQNFTLEDPAPSISMATDDDIYANCTDYMSLVEFTRRYPNSSHFSDAIKRIWDIEDNAYPQLGTSIPAYRKALLLYKETYPNSHKESLLFNELNKLLLDSTTLGTVYDYRTLLRLYPEHPKKSIILGRLDLASFKMCKTTADFQDYLSNFPTGHYRMEAEKRIQAIRYEEEKNEFDKCVTITDYNQFVAKYPTSQLFNEVLKRIEYLVYKESVRSGNHSNYYKEYPKGQYISNLRKIEDENCYQSCKTIKDYKAYLKKYPNGFDSKNAKQKIDKYNTKRYGLIFGIIIVVLLITSIYLGISTASNTNQTNNIAVDEDTLEVENNYQYDNEHSYTDDAIVSDNINEDDEWDGVLPSDKIDAEIRRYQNNQLSTGAKPYSSQIGSAKTGENYMTFKTSKGCDYIIIAKSSTDNSYYNHVYIRGGDHATIYLPDGTYTVYFYSGIGWNPNKIKGDLSGGFVSSEALQKDGPIELESSYCEYTLYPVQNGNLSLKKAKESDVFN